MREPSHPAPPGTPSRAHIVRTAAVFLVVTALLATCLFYPAPVGETAASVPAEGHAGDSTACTGIMSAAGNDYRSWLNVLFRRTELNDTRYPIDGSNGYLLSVDGIDHTLAEVDNHDLARQQWTDEIRHGRQVLHDALRGLEAGRRQQAVSMIDTIYDRMIDAQLKQDVLADRTSQALREFLTTARTGTPGALYRGSDGRYQTAGPLADRLVDQTTRISEASSVEIQSQRETSVVINAGIAQIQDMLFAKRPGVPPPLCRLIL